MVPPPIPSGAQVELSGVIFDAGGSAVSGLTVVRVSSAAPAAGFCTSDSKAATTSSDSDLAADVAGAGVVADVDVDGAGAMPEGSEFRQPKGSMNHSSTARARTVTAKAAETTTRVKAATH